MTKLEELKAALAAATPGEWERSSGGSRVQNYVYSSQPVSNASDGDSWKPVICVTDDDEPVAYEANAHLIALMHNALPALIECAEAMLALGDAFDIGQRAGDTSAIGKYRKALAKLNGEPV